MTTEKEIAPRIVDGEPVCSGKECPAYNLCGPMQIEGVPCYSGLRRQRDEARRELCRQISENIRGGIEREDIASGRGWSYLYEGEKK